MGDTYQLEFDGQSVTQGDYNGLAAAAGSADDKVFAELFRLTPYDGSVYSGVIPYGTAGIIAGNGASGKSKVNPIRVVIGSRTAVGTDAAANWSDNKSGISIADGATTLYTLIDHADNASGDPRWDAIYAEVIIDEQSTPVTRKVKNPGTGVITDESVSAFNYVSVEIKHVAGAAAATPAFPSIPADSGTTYNVLLGYVRIPDGFGATSTVANKDINEVANILYISPVAGVSILRPANQQYETGGTAISSSGTSTLNGILAWTGTAATRPGVYMPPSMVGSQSRLIAMDFTHASSANWSHQDDDIVDDSVDWRKRIFKWTAYVGEGTGTAGHTFPWNHPALYEYEVHETMCAGGTSVGGGFYGVGEVTGQSTNSGMGQSFVPFVDAAPPAVNNNAYIMRLAAGETTAAVINMVTGTAVWLYVDMADGALKVRVDGAPLASVFVWLDATAQYPNA